MKTVFLTITILFFSLCGIGQTSEFNRTFYFGSGVFGITSIFPCDSGYILTGSYNAKVGVCLMDLYGNYKWVKEYSYLPYDPTLGYYPTEFNKTSDNKYITAGTIQNGNATINKAYLLKIDSCFNQDYVKYLIEENNCNGCTAFEYVFENSLGNYVIVGENARDSAGNFLLNKIGDGILIITDTAGNILNYKHYGGQYNYHDHLYYSLQIGNNYYLFGQTLSYAPSSVTYTWDRYDGWIIKTDLEGNKIDSAAYGNPILADRELTYAIPLSNSKILTGKDIGISTHPSGFRMYQPWIVIINNDLSISKEIFLKSTYVSGDTIFNSYIENAIMDKDSAILFLGRNILVSISGHTTILSNAFVFKLSKDYKVLFYREYKHNGGTFDEIYPSVITTTSDSGFIFGGGVLDFTLTPYQQAWLVKTDSLGCDGFTSCNDTALVVEILNCPDTLCQNDTNFVEVRLKGRSAPYSLYTNGTLLLDSIYYPYTLPLWIDTTIMVLPTDTGWQDLVINLHEPWDRTASDTVHVYVANCPTTYASTNFYKRKVEIFPNPATTELHVKVRGVIENSYTITMYDTQGKTVDIITTNDQETMIDISKYPQGVYWIRVLGNNIVRSEKIIKLMTN